MQKFEQYLIEKIKWQEEFAREGSKRSRQLARVRLAVYAQVLGEFRKVAA